MNDTLIRNVYLIGWAVSFVVILFWVRKKYDTEDFFTALMCGIVGGGFWPFALLAGLSIGLVAVAFSVYCFLMLAYDFIKHKILRI